MSRLVFRGSGSGNGNSHVCRWWQWSTPLHVAPFFPPRAASTVSPLIPATNLAATYYRSFTSTAQPCSAHPPPLSGTTHSAATTRHNVPFRPDYSSYYKQKNSNLLYYSASIILGTLTLSYASVPLYRAICQRTGFGGIPITDSTRFTPDKLQPVPNAPRIRVTFASSVSSNLDWKFTPQQREVRVVPGETALAFYKAENRSSEDIIGVATYSVTPGQVAQYFSKIQCFCFEEQKLTAGEEVDMPVFFFIDPEFTNDPAMKGIEQVTLSYTFFKAKYEDGEIQALA